MSRQIWVNSYLTIISCFLTSSIALVRIAIMIFADIDENLLRFRSSKIFEVHVKSLQRSLWVFVLWSLHSGTWRIFSGSWTILQDPEGYSISKRIGPWEFYRILMYTICSFLQYCAKVMQTKFVEFHSLFLRNFVEISIEISETSDAFWNENSPEFRWRKRNFAVAKIRWSEILLSFGYI